MARIIRCAVVRMRGKEDTISGGNGEGVPPVPIPNTEVKPFSAESTWLVTARKHRSPPDPIAGHGSVLLFVTVHGVNSDRGWVPVPPAFPPA